ncbi:ras GTPase-activating protein raskol isoform X14 [Vespula squamosa]|uniref:Ras GTPase-activating protein raskol isoform X14 n=1 Tax=Vespula squamosa TaxID=30214 RepID=A0ABD2A3W2_VESSQ
MDVIRYYLGDAMFVELPRVRLDGGARAFRQHWGYESRPLAPPPPLIEEDEAAVEPETVSLREANTASPIAVIHKTPDTIIVRALSEAPDMPSPEEPS